ncbi:response regulator transcription factor [Loigolactobacillus zhaoyuanensis]|uniref:Response regulator transcription factor n=1 Tax=Loigolactobacillus zhaoyuanensis TaxID=2486017 RepID=A0ABW8UEK5_9LACO|nr:response regulator transcription factor [Loigolactobacillus zhaoyuanensis]
MATILIIEDDAAIHQILETTLRQHQFQIINAFSGTEGRLRFDPAKVDLILLDLMLPGMSGEALLAELRQISAVPIIVLSAKHDQTVKLAMLAHGADDYITKPFDLAELVARINIQIRHATSSPQPALLRYEQLSIDSVTRQVMFAQKSLQLTAREYAILKLFLQQPHKVFSRRNLYESVWQDDYIDGEKTINVHISNLRNKLRQVGADYIQTVWGVGFKFD